MATEFTSRKVLDIFNDDISERQLQWWDEKGLLVPKMISRRRVYSAADILDVAFIAELRRKGVSIQKIRAIVRRLRKACPLKRFEDSREELFLLTDGKAILIEPAAGVIVRLKSACAALTVISLSDCWRRVRGCK